eukprot:Seg18.6 transcript_id=Seg18.6/GoldUCD/mRNA.D3Y31 product="39S ribosomal protein L21 mitochondrial" pseudo=true protein_id=Seg18.6/GoldUCD/D3Y31
MATKMRHGTIYSAYCMISRACCRAGIDTKVQSNVLRSITTYLGKRPECVKRSGIVTRFRHATAVRMAQTQQVSKEKNDESKVACDEKRDTLVEKVKKAMAEDQAFRRIFAVIHIAGRQFKVTSNDIIMINKSTAKCGDKLKLQKILMVGGREFSIIGKPLLSTDQVNIEATVLEKPQGRNVIVFKKKRRKNYKRWKDCDFACRQQCLKLHNKYRENHQVPPMVLDEALCKQAQQWADNNATMKSSEWVRTGGGECWAWGTLYRSWTDVVKDWHDQEIHIDWKTKKSKDGNSVYCFSQVVWKRAKKLGCGRGTLNGSSFYVAQIAMAAVVTDRLIGYEGDNIQPPKVNDLHWFNNITMTGASSKAPPPKFRYEKVASKEDKNEPDFTWTRVGDKT